MRDDMFREETVGRAGTPSERPALMAKFWGGEAGAPEDTPGCWFEALFDPALALEVGEYMAAWGAANLEAELAAKAYDEEKLQRILAEESRQA